MLVIDADTSAKTSGVVNIETVCEFEGVGCSIVVLTGCNNGAMVQSVHLI